MKFFAQAVVVMAISSVTVALVHRHLEKKGVIQYTCGTKGMDDSQQ